MYVCMYVALITRQFVVEMEWKKLHLRESMGAESYTADTAKAVPVSNLGTAHNVKSRATFSD